MTRDDITRMGLEAGMDRIVALEHDGTQTFEAARIDLLERLAALVAAHIRETEFKPDWNNYQQGLIDGAAAEREQCHALLLEIKRKCHDDDRMWQIEDFIDEAIRARGGKA